MRYHHEMHDVRTLAKAVAAGPRGSLPSGLLPRPGTVHAIFSLRDPRPSLTTLRKLGEWVAARKDRMALKASLW